MTREEAINQLKDFIILHREQHGWDVSTLNALDMAIKALEQTRWVPVTERLPEKQGMYVVTIKSLCKNYITTDLYNTLYKNGFRYQDVIAWMPLPEPYKAESEGKA